MVRHALGIGTGIVLGTEVRAALILCGREGAGENGRCGGIEIAGDVHAAVSILAGDAKAAFAGSGVRIGLAGWVERVLICFADGLAQPFAQGIEGTTLGLLESLVAQFARAGDGVLAEAAQLVFDEVEDALGDRIFLKELLATLLLLAALAVSAAAGFLLGSGACGIVRIGVRRGSGLRIGDGCEEVASIAEAGGGLGIGKA